MNPNDELDDLLAFEEVSPPPAEPTEEPSFIGVESAPATLNLSDIGPNRWNPHRMTEAEQTDLEASVLEDGQWRPILVVELDEPDETMDADDVESAPAYRIVDGEHLYRAMTSLYLAGKHDGVARALILGKNSEIPVWKQQEIGQTINHGMRGSEEDPEKTKRVLNNILRHRKPEVVAKRMGLGIDGVKHLAKPVAAKNPAGVTPPPKPTPGTAPAASTTGLGGAVKTRNEERKSYTIALVFEEAAQLKAFEERVTQAAAELGVERGDFVGKNGQYRIHVLTEALELAIEGPSDPDPI